MFKEAPARAGAQAEMSCTWGHFMQDRESELRRMPRMRSSHKAGKVKFAEFPFLALE